MIKNFNIIEKIYLVIINELKFGFFNIIFIFSNFNNLIKL